MDLTEVHRLAQPLLTWNFVQEAIGLQATGAKADLQEEAKSIGVEWGKPAGGLYNNGMTGKLLPSPPYFIILDMGRLESYIIDKLNLLGEELVNRIKGLRQG